MGWFRDGAVAEAPVLPASPHRWVVVDVETSGRSAAAHRVLSVAAVALDERGRPEGEFTSLVDAGCDPGPVHVHGLTRDVLTGAPCFADVTAELAKVLEGRVMVAHNASFDYSFLAADADRARWTLPTQARLCTLALSRRLGLEVPNHQLGTLAGYWRVPQQRAHDARDDARVLASVFTHSAALADRLGLTLPVMACTEAVRARFGAHIARTLCVWANPGPLRPGEPLVQGMKVVITGATRQPRETLAARLTAAGLDVLNSVSRQSSLLVCSDAGSITGKARRARECGVTVVDEDTLLRLLLDVRGGVPKHAPEPAPALPTPPTSVVSPPTPTTPAEPVARPCAPVGSMSRRRVLVLGGPHERAAAIRAAVIARGGAAAVNLSANVTEILVLDGAEGDRRLARAAAAGVTIHRDPAALGIDPDEAQPAAPTEPPVGDEVSGDRAVGPAALSRGAVTDLPAGDVWTVNVAWRADALRDGAELDVVAFVVDAERRVGADEDFVFYNAPMHPSGAVELSYDADSEQSVRIDTSLLTESHARVVVAAVVSGECTFGDIGPVAVNIDSADATAATATLDAATTERSMLLAEIYRRGDTWRVRAQGQGYDDGLAELAVRHGVDVDD